MAAKTYFWNVETKDGVACADTGNFIVRSKTDDVVQHAKDTYKELHPFVVVTSATLKGMTVCLHVKSAIVVDLTADDSEDSDLTTDDSEDSSEDDDLDLDIGGQCNRMWGY